MRSNLAIERTASQRAHARCFAAAHRRRSTAMAQWHLDELRGAFERKGWRVAAEHPGDDYKVSGTWDLHRPGDSRILLIDFEGLNDLHVPPIHESYACSVRGTNHSLYFRRRGESGSPARTRWRGELQSFVESVSAQAAV